MRVLCGGSVQCGSVYEATSEPMCNRQLAKRDPWTCALDVYDSYVRQLVIYHTAETINTTECLLFCLFSTVAYAERNINKHSLQLNSRDL